MAAIPEIPDVKMDVYEEDEDPDLDVANANQKVWLVKLPKFVFDKWTSVQKGDEFLGNVVVTGGGENVCIQLKLILPDSSNYSDIPIEYDLQIQNRGVENVYVFTEKDIPGVPQPDISLPYHDRPPPPTGKVIYECNAKPVINTRYSNYMKQRNKAAVPQRQAQMLSETSFHGTVLAPGTTGASAGRFNSFTKGTKMIKTGSSTDLKMTRLPKNELLDLLFKCFHDYEYWSLKGLREIVRQPEVYLKEILEDIAILNKRGPYALKWCLKPEFKGTVPSNEMNVDRQGEVKKGESSDENMEDV